MQPDEPEAPPAESVLVEAPASPLKRLLALVALVALLASAGLSSCWILTGRATFVSPAVETPEAPNR